MKTVPYFLACIAACSSLPAARAAQVGDPAAPLEIGEWVKGEAVDLATAKGKQIVVVEFWATWCGPCRASIPHLSELQRKFADRGVVVVGVSDETAAKVKPFVDEMGEKMDYTVALDRERKTFAGYMKAFGEGGIPHAFVVDREGKIAWHGHPMMGLDQTLERLAAMPVKENPIEKKRAEAQRLLREYTELAAAGDNARLAALQGPITALDRELGGITPGEKLDLEALRKSARFQSLMRDYQRAVAAGRPEADLRKLEQEAAPLAPPGFKFEDFRGQFSLQRTFQEYYRIVTGKGDAARLPALTLRLESVQTGEPEALNEMAWTLLTDDSIKTRNPGLALKLAQAACQASGGKDPSVLDTYARALFDNGQAAQAVEQQKQAVRLATDDDKRKELEASLKRYQAGAAGK